jgi:hypothetical protein
VQEETVAAGASPTPSDKFKDDGKPLEAMFSGFADKAARRALHMLLKGKHGLPRLVTDTVTTDTGEQVIRLMTQAGLQASAKCECAAAAIPIATKEPLRFTMTSFTACM